MCTGSPSTLAPMRIPTTTSGSAGRARATRWRRWVFWLLYIDLGLCLIWFSGLLAVRAGLRVPHTGQCISGAQAGHQSAEKGQSAGDAGGQDESADTQDHISGIEDHVWHAQGLCDIVTNSEAQLSTDFLKRDVCEKTTTTTTEKTKTANHTIYIRNAIGANDALFRRPFLMALALCMCVCVFYA